MNTEALTIGFIGQGYVGKNYADEFSSRGYTVLRYSLEEPHIGNKDRIQECGIVFIAVPTPTTTDGFSAGLVEEALTLVGEGKTAVIKSTITPGTTERLQEAHPGITVLFSPEFLSEATAADDVAHPFMSVVGVVGTDPERRIQAEQVLSILPNAPYRGICSSSEAEIIKYIHNGNGYMQVLFFNMMYDLAQSFGADWQTIQNAVLADPFVSNFYAQPVHKTGRGAGGHCFIKDFAALREVYEKQIPNDERSSALLRAAESKNIELLKSSGKDLDLLAGVYGEEST